MTTTISRVIFFALVCQLCGIRSSGQVRPNLREMRGVPSAVIVERANKKLESEIQQARPEVQKAAAEVPQITDPGSQPLSKPETTSATTADEPKRVPVATKEQTERLMKLISAFGTHASESQERYSMAATAILFSGCGLALIASILSFLRINNAAGIVGLLVAALTALPSAYPLNNLVSFHRALSAQSEALFVDCSLKEPMTIEEFNSASKQFQLLVLFKGEKYPQLGSTRDLSGELVTELQKLKPVTLGANSSTGGR